MMANPKYIRTLIPLLKKEIAVYASPRIAQTFNEVALNMNLYKGVKLTELLAAVYEQGKKDGARSVFEQVDVLKDQIAHRIPGQPRKRKK